MEENRGQDWLNVTQCYVYRWWLKSLALSRKTKDAHRHKQQLRNWSEVHTSSNTHMHTLTPAGAAVPRESGWRDKCVLKARLKGSLKEERLWQKCVLRDFLFFAHLCVCVCLSVYMNMHPCMCSISMQAGCPSSLTTYTGPDTQGLIPTD